jgi:ELWxxDGT repeat protein
MKWGFPPHIHPLSHLLPAPMTRFLILAILCLGLTLIAGAQAEPKLVRDINRSPLDFSARIQWIMPVDQGVVFQMSSVSHGAELWASDGSPGGTRLLKDIVPGTASSDPREPKQVGNKVAFVANAPDFTDQLWITDGTEAGTTMVLDALAIENANRIIPQAGAEHGLFFNVEFEIPAGYRELWFTDGTAGGTRSLGTLSIYPDGGGFDFNVSGSYCYFLAYENEVWRSDGSVAGTVKLLDGEEAIGHGIHDITVADSRLYLSVGTGEDQVELWTAGLDGSNPLRLGSPDAPWTFIEEIVTSGDAATLVIWDYNYNLQLAHSDGTPEGTRILPLVHRGDSGIGPAGTLFAWNGIVYFSAESPAQGYELWRTDGTPEGTYPLKDILPGPVSSHPWEFIVSGGYLYFQTAIASQRRQLWRTAGTTKSTRLVARLKDNYPFGGNGPLVASSGGEIYYDDHRNSTEHALWKTRPSGRGVQRLTTPERSATASTFPNGGDGQYRQLGADLLSFVYLPGSVSPELWRIDDAGRMKSIWAPVLKANHGTPRFIASLPGQALLRVPGANETPDQLWVTDGTPRGTRRLNKQVPYEHFHAFAQAGPAFYYTTYNQSGSANKVWKTDGTPAGTVAIDIPSMPMSSELVVMNSLAYFMARDTTSGQLSLWSTDGTADGTAEIYQWSLSQSLGDPRLGVVGDELVFAIGYSLNNRFWRSDGTAAGTYSYANPYLSFETGNIGRSIDLGGLQLFQGSPTGSGGLRWFRSNGTAQGTYAMLPDAEGQATYAYSLGDSPTTRAILGTTLFYAGKGEETGSELWATDGTAAGTRLVKDIRPGFNSSTPDEFLAVGDTIYFTADAPGSGRELWKSDGTEAGTVLVADLEPGPLGSDPDGLYEMNGTLYFTANRRTIGRELYALGLE